VRRRRKDRSNGWCRAGAGSVERDRLGPVTLPPTDTVPSKTAFCFRRCGPQQLPSDPSPKVSSLFSESSTPGPPARNPSFINGLHRNEKDTEHLKHSGRGVLYPFSTNIPLTVCITLVIGAVTITLIYVPSLLKKICGTDAHELHLVGDRNRAIYIRHLDSRR